MNAAIFFLLLFKIMFSKIDLANVTFSLKWYQILKSDRLSDHAKYLISIYLDLLEISDKSEDKKLKYVEQHDSFKNLLSVFNVSDISKIKTKRISNIKDNSDFKKGFEKFSKILFSDF